MILYKDWGQHLRLGNWLFLWATINKIANKTGHRVALPDYFLWKYLEHPPILDVDFKKDGDNFHFGTFNYTEEENTRILSYFAERQNENVNINLGANCQGIGWWKDDLGYVNKQLKFKEDCIKSVYDKYELILGNGKKTIGVSVRRGDFVNHGCFYQIPTAWYEEALKSNFPDWENCNILFFSDNINEIKKMFSGKNYYFAEHNNTYTHKDNFVHYRQDPMDQFILGTLCDGMIIGNSTFSWWMGYYIDQFKNGKVVHSGENHRGECAKTYYNPGYYPEHWTLHKITTK